MPQVLSKPLKPYDPAAYQQPAYGSVAPTSQAKTPSFNPQIQEWQCPYWMRIASYVPVVGAPFATICTIVPEFIKCWNAFWAGGANWQNIKKECSALMLAIEAMIVVAIALIVWFGYPYFSEGFDLINTLRTTANTLVARIVGPVKDIVKVAWTFLNDLLGFLTPLAENMGVSPFLLKINAVTLFIWAGLMVGADAEGVLDDFFAGDYGDLGRHVYTIFGWLTWPERKIKSMLDDISKILGGIASIFTLPYEAGALVFSFPIAMVLYPLMNLIDDADRDINELDPNLKAKAWKDPFKKTSNAHNDVVPSGVPERVCAKC